MLILAVGVIGTVMVSYGSVPSDERIKSSPQFRDDSFVNQEANIEMNIGTTISTLWEFLFNKKDTKPKGPIPRATVDQSVLTGLDRPPLRTTWLGHSSLIIEVDGFVIATDPVLEKSVSYFGPTRYNGEAPLRPEDLPMLDLVLISHNHYDHLNRFTIERIHQKTKQFIAPPGVKELLVQWGVPSDRVVELDWWEDADLGDGLKIVSTPAQHFSGRGLFDRNKTLWCSYVIKTEEHSLFFGGDSGYFSGFKTIGAKQGPFDMTFLECGAYNERWLEIHMTPEQTVQAHLDLGGTVLHPIHWGTFDLAFHPWNEPMQRVTQSAEKNDVRLATPVVGGSVVYNGTSSGERWWEQVEVTVAR